MINSKNDFPHISVILVGWNSALYLAHCLECLAAQTYDDFEVILVDNGSTDGSLKGLEENWPGLHLRLERLPKNLGFAAANNIGARHARGQWLALLNVDAFPESHWLEQLINASEQYSGYSAFSSRQIQASNPVFLDGAGDAYHISGLAWRRYIGYPTEGYGQEPLELFSPSATAAMYARDAFLDVGGFDEDFFSYFEDVDLGFRLQLRGYRCCYVPQAVVHHVGSATLGVRSDFAFYYSHRNMVWTFVKNMPSSMFWRYLPAHFLANLIYVLYYVLRGRGKVLWRAKWDALKELPEILRKRKLIQMRNQAAPAELERLMEHGWFQPYLLKYKRNKAIHKANIRVQ